MLAPVLWMLTVFSCSGAAGGDPVPLTVSSPDFAAGGEIPPVHTCQGTDIAPGLAWTGAPASTASFAVIVDDPDAPDPASPRMTWVHWVVYNLPAGTTGLPRARPLPTAAVQGLNDWHAIGFRGPCPPVGRHRYVHKVYALDAALPVADKVDKGTLEKMMKGHILGYGELIGTYEKR